MSTLTKKLITKVYQSNSKVLTTEVFNEEGMRLMLLFPDTHSANEYQQIANTTDHGNQPNTHTMDDEIQQVFYGGDTITLRHAVSDVRGIAAVVKCLERTESSVNNEKYTVGHCWHIFWIHILNSGH